jgi:hypothetical protein
MQGQQATARPSHSSSRERGKWYSVRDKPTRVYHPPYAPGPRPGSSNEIPFTFGPETTGSSGSGGILGPMAPATANIVNAHMCFYRRTVVRLSHLPIYKNIFLSLPLSPHMHQHQPSLDLCLCFSLAEGLLKRFSALADVVTWKAASLSYSFEIIEFPKRNPRDS